MARAAATVAATAGVTEAVAMVEAVVAGERVAGVRAAVAMGGVATVAVAMAVEMAGDSVEAEMEVVAMEAALVVG